MRKTPHDAFFTFAFSFSQLYLDFFEQILPKWFVELFDLSTLKPIEGAFLSQKLRKFYTDKLFSCKLKTGEEAIIACLLEHKSYVPTYIYDQLQRYVVEKYDYDKRNDHPRSLVVPIIIYHGKAKWVKKPPHAVFSGIPSILRKFASAPDYILIDISKFTKKRILALRMGYWVNALLMLKYSSDPVYLGNNLDEVFMYGEYYEYH